MIATTMGAALAAAALCLTGAVATTAAAAPAASGISCQGMGTMLESVQITNSSGAPVGRVQRFRDPLTRINCAETYASVGDGAAITAFVVVDGHKRVVRGGSVGVRWSGLRGCVTFGGTVDDDEVSAKACG